MGFCMDVNFQFIWANIKVQIAGLCDECIEFCSRLAVLKSGCTILHFHQQWVKVPAAPHSYHHLELSVFWILTILIGVSQYLVILLICISWWNPVWSIFFRCLFAFVHLLCWGVCVQLFVTLWTVVHQAPLFTGFSRQEYWSGLPFPSPGESSWPRDQTRVSCIAGRFFTTDPVACLGILPIFKEKGCSLSYCWVLRVFFIFCIIVLYQICLLQILSPSLWFVFSFSWWSII